MSKKIAFLGLRLADEDKAAIEAAARSAGVSISEYVRRLHITKAHAPAPVVAVANTPMVHRVDQIGPDPLWSGKETL